MSTIQGVDEYISNIRGFITYVPLRTEVIYAPHISLPPNRKAYEIAPRPSLNPATEALTAMKKVANTPACILMPGKRFDALGTRHGQGGGWYDRFLARVPSEWLRIGFCYTTQFSPEPLKRESWDQPVDFVCVVNKETNTSTWHKTDARTLIP